jgi:hypothetical protein
VKLKRFTLRRVSAALLGWLMVLTCHADPVPEYRMKAAFLYNFALFTEWPKTTDTSLRLCIFSSEPLGEALAEIEGHEVNGLKLRVVHLSNASAARSCQILYLGESVRADVKNILRELGDAPVLTVSDVEDLAKSGIMLNVFPVGRRLAFEVYAEPVKRAHLTLSPRLLRLARSVY